MSPTLSSRSLRVRGLQSDTSIDQLHNAMQALAKPKRRSKYGLFSSTAASTIEADKPACFLARQGDFVTATVSFASPAAKTQAIKNVNDKDIAKDWEVDDNFDGITVLRDANDIEIEYVIFRYSLRIPFTNNLVSRDQYSGLLAIT